MTVTSGQFHEDLQERGGTPRGSSDRAFGLVFACFFLIVAVWPLRRQQPLRVWSIVLSGLLLVISLSCPIVLRGFNLLWTRLGLRLSRVTNPIITGLVFFLVFVPTALILRLLGRDPLRLKYERNASSYWVERKPAGPAPEGMADQF